MVFLVIADGAPTIFGERAMDVKILLHAVAVLASRKN